MPTAPQTPDCIPADDRGYLYGDGVFETLLVHRGRALWPDLHLDRAMRGVARLAMDVPREAVADAIASAAETARGEWCVLRCTVTRGSGPRGYAPPPESACRITCQLTALAGSPLAQTSAARVGLSDVRLAVQPMLAGIKHLNRLEQVMAAAEAARRELDDVLLRSTLGHLHSSAKANLFLCLDGALATAPCDGCGIEGTRRRLVMEQLAPALGLEVRERALCLDDLAAADAAFLSNSIIGIRPIASVDGRPLDTAAVEPIVASYRQEVRAWLG